MPHVSLQDLSGWLEEYRKLGVDSGDPTVLDVSWDPETIDTALVLVRLATSGTEVLLQRQLGGAPDWIVTFQAREWDSLATPSQVMQLAGQLESVAHLCEYLTERTRGHLHSIGLGPA